MPKIDWSDSQHNAIFSKYRKNGESANIIVSAAAGSGKTAVLVQRIIEKLLPDDPEKSIDANRLLVVTFTKAAAHEMSERIKKALDEKLASARESGDIVRQQQIKNQQLLIQDAEINTIDAFCMRLIRRHFNVLDIAPDFSVLDETQAELLKNEAMYELFSELYEEENIEFYDLLFMYASNRDDTGLKNLIDGIYNFIMKIPNPLSWLDKRIEELKLENGAEDTFWYKKSLEIANPHLEYAFSEVCKALKFIFGDCDLDAMISENPPVDGNGIYDEWRSYYKLFYIYYTGLRDICKADMPEKAILLRNLPSPRFYNNKRLSEEDMDILRAYSGNIKPAVAIAKRNLDFDTDGLLTLSREKLYPVAKALGRITERFCHIFYEKKREKNLFEFTDIEQLSYKLLSENPDIAAEIQAQYEEVLMDEYQDTSLLQEAIFSCITDGKNLFTVGDMKQSIYRFRSSDPTIFKARLDNSSLDADAPDRKINLSQNFRSRAEVLDSINDIFSAIMSEDAGELDYDESQRLYYGKKDYPETEFDYKSECVVIESDSVTQEENDISGTALEARYIASEIVRLKNEHFQICGKDGKLRDIENRDIVILMSSHKSAADIFTSELNTRGIECFVEQLDYFTKDEVRLMLSLLRIINNPYADIPLVSVLRSPIGTFSDNELAAIRSAKKGRFFSALKEFTAKKDGEDAKTAKKAEEFCEKLDRWRRYARYMPVDKLIWTLYEETDFYAFCGALYGGDYARANLRLLFERAKQYEAYGFGGLFGFVKYMERVKKREKDLSSAKLVGENNDVVRIMTIHKSKGLEFPVVFLAGGGTMFKNGLDNTRFIMHKDYGITLDYINFEKNYTVVSPLKKIFRNVIASEQLSERIRVLYVAMTRAREKLYFVASARNTNSAELTNGRLNPDIVLGASSFKSLVLPVARSSGNWNFKSVSPDELPKFIKEETAETAHFDGEIPDVAKLLEFTYPYPDISAIASKVSVSELKADGVTELIPKPSFLAEKKRSGTSYGTLIHSVLEHLVPCGNMDLEYVKSAISELVLKGIIEKEDSEAVNPEKILAFYRSDIGKRIIKSENVFREQPFELLVPVSLLYPDFKGAEDEKIILQGVIDCWFTEGDEIVLVDYKTDSFTNIDEIHQKYDRQLELYAYAIEKITGKNIKSKNIYLFSVGNVIQCQ